MNPQMKIQITQGVGVGRRAQRSPQPPLLPFKSGGPRWLQVSPGLDRKECSVHLTCGRGRIHTLLINVFGGV